MLNPTTPSLSAPPTVRVATQLLESATLVTVAALPRILTDGVPISSLEANVKVTTSVSIARVLSKLLEAMEIDPKIGLVLSNVI